MAITTAENSSPSPADAILAAGADVVVTSVAGRLSFGAVARAMLRAAPDGLTTRELLAGGVGTGERDAALVLRGGIAHGWAIRVFVPCPSAETGERRERWGTGDPGTTGKRSIWFASVYAARAVVRAYADTPAGRWGRQDRSVIRAAERMRRAAEAVA